MYPERGRGAIVEVVVTDAGHTEFHRRFPNFPQGTWGGRPLQEKPSDLADKQLRKFVDPGTPDTLFYEYVQDGKIKYRTMCDEPGAVARRVIETCVLSFPYGGTRNQWGQTRLICINDGANADSGLEA
jgi:hypothetical protein